MSKPRGKLFLRYASTLTVALLAACSSTEKPEVLLQKAQLAYQKGDNKTAVIQVKSALQQQPTLAPARELLAQLHNRGFDGPSAEKEIRRAIELGVDPKQAQPVLIRALLLQSKFNEVVAGTEDAATPEMLSMRGSALLSLGKLEQARQAYEQALRGEPDQVAALTGLGQLSMRASDPQAARGYAERLVQRHPDSALAWQFKADLAYSMRANDEALEAYGRVIALDPGKLQAHIARSYIFGVKHDNEAAQAEVKQAAKLAPGSLVVLYAQAIVDYNAGRNKQALEGLQTVLSKSPDHMPALLLSGAVQLALDALPQAQQDLERYLESAPDNRYARKLLATALLRQGHGEQALARLAPLLTDDKDVEALTLAGKCYVATGKFEAASALFARAVASKPDTPALRTALGLSRMGQGQEAAALAEMDAAAKMEKGETVARLALATSALQTKHYDKALSTIAELERESPNDPSLKLMRGGAFEGKKDLAQARASYQQALTQKADYFPAVAALARLELQAGQPDATVRRLTDYAASQPKQVAPLTLLSELARARGDGAQALQWARKAAALQPDEPATTAVLGRELLANQQPAEALTLLRKATAAQPASEELLDVLAQAQLANGDMPSALESYSKLTGLAPRNPLSHARLGAAYMLAKNDGAAEVSLKKAVNLMPTYVPAQLSLSTLYMRQNKLDKALAVARQLQQQPANAAAGYSMEGDMLSATQPGPALAAYERAFALQPTTGLLIRQHILLSQTGRRAQADQRMARWTQERGYDADAARYLAESAIFYKDYGSAVQQLRQILTRQPKDVAALNNLAYAYQQQKDPQASATAEQALQLDGANPAVQDTLGWILLQEGKQERALQLLKQAVAASPDAPVYRYHLAYGLFQAGDRGQARKELEQALSSKRPFELRQQALDLRKRLDGGPGTA